MFKLPDNCTQHSLPMLVRLCSKSFKLGFSSIWIKNFQMYKLGLEKAEDPEIKLPTFFGSCRKHRNSKKTSTSASLTMLKLLTVWITTNCRVFFKRWEWQTTLPVSWETCIKVKKQWSEVGTEQQTASKLKKEFAKAVYCHHANLTYMQSVSRKMPGWINHKLESRLQEKYQQPQICRWYHSKKAKKN